MTTVGSYDAKTHLAKLLDEVELGKRVTITRHGREVAQIVPVRGARTSTDEVIASLRTARRGVRRGRTSVRSMIDDGRR